jgi:ATP-dependent RNA helicase SUPV3L1/SUV3
LAAGDTSGEVTPAAAPAAETAAAAAPAEAAEPALVEVWRPGGRSEERRPRHEHQRGRHHHRPHQDRGQQASGEQAAAPGEGEQRERHRHGAGGGRRDRVKEFGKDFRKGPPREGAQAAGEGQPPREDRGPRRDHDNKGRDRNAKGGKFGGEREGRQGRDFRDKGGRDKGGPSHRPYASSAGPRDRDRPIDPNSPFAKLAALKEQLSANNRKD